MKFTEVLEENMRLRWRAYYVNYRSLKACIEDMEGGKDATNVHFITMLRENLVKALRFYERTEERLSAQIRASQAPSTPTARSKSRSDLEHEVRHLRSYAHYNLEAIRKIAKKYDKRCGVSKTMQADIMENLNESLLADGEDRCSRMLKLLEEPAGTPEDWAQPLLSHTSRRHSRLLLPILDKHTRGNDSPTDLTRLPSGIYAWQPPMEILWANAQSPEAVVFVVLACLSLFLWQLNLTTELDGYSYFTMFVTLEALFMLLKQYQADVVLISSTLLLRLVGALDNDRDAWGGFSNSVVLSVAVLGIVSAGVHHTGVIDFLFMRVLGHPKTYFFAILRLSIPAMPLATSISNTCVMGVLIPVIDKWCKEINMPPRLFLMPMSYIMLVIGAFAIFSTSSNLVVQSLLMERGLEPFDNFAISSLSFLCGTGTLLYLAVAVPTILATEAASPQSPNKASAESKKLFLANIQISGSSLGGRSLTESGLLTVLGGVASIVRVERMGTEVALANLDENFLLEQHDILYVWCTANATMELINTSGITLIALDGGYEHQHRDEGREIVEVVLDGLCPLVKQPLSYTTGLDSYYGGNCLAIRPCSMQHFSSPQAQAAEVRTFVSLLRNPHANDDGAYRFRIGDNLILDVPRHFTADYESSAHFSLVRKLSDDEDDQDGATSSQKKRDMIISGLLLVGMIILVASNSMPLLEAALLTSFLMVVTGCLPQQKAFSAINLRIVLTIVGAFGIAKAVNKTNLAAVLAHMICTLLAPFGIRGIFTGIFLATVGLGIVFHATAVVSLLFPIVVAISESPKVPVPLHQAMAVLMMGAACQVLSPVSYQTNIMVFSSGCYTFADFPKVGLGVVLIVGVISVGFVDQLVSP
ncbi:SAC1 [Symbiodinium natans]|uniref:SAC1 protein n=1 Tax=Symbiodinium natans TaxID=878477 RepID=A0A812UEU4_9DINO|nr:SAC1 [Symbiodinium natans]